MCVSVDTVLYAHGLTRILRRPSTDISLLRSEVQALVASINMSLLRSEKKRGAAAAPHFRAGFEMSIISTLAECHPVLVYITAKSNCS